MTDSNYPPPDEGAPPPGGYQPYSQGPSDPMAGAGGFFAALFDFNFTSFVTPKIVKIVYVLAVVALTLTYLFFVIGGFVQNVGLGLLVLIVGAVAFFVYLALFRMTLEFYYALIRMSEDIHQRLPRG